MENRSLLNLPYEVLLLIFAEMDDRSLGRLSKTCKHFKDVIAQEDSLWRPSSLSAFGSNMSSRAMELRCKPILKYRERCKISRQWRKQLGDIADVAIYRRCMPCLVLQRDFLYFSQGRTLEVHSRAPNGHAYFKPTVSYVPFTDDISKFVVNETEIVCGGRDGSVARLHKGNLSVLDSFVAHHGEVLTVDSNQDVMISGSRDCCVKIWKNSEHLEHFTVRKMSIPVGNRVLSTSIMHSKTSFAVGTPGTNGVHPLQLYDIERGKLIQCFGNTYRYGAGILDIAPESHNTFLSCGYDTTLKLWDMRYPAESVGTWTEPFDSTMYCLQTDNNVTMLTGTSHSGCFSVWDKRSCKKPVKVYHVPMKGTRRQRQALIPPYFYKGPVYDIDFDAAHIYCAFDTTLLQFSYMGACTL